MLKGYMVRESLVTPDLKGCSSRIVTTVLRCTKQPFHSRKARLHLAIANAGATDIATVFTVVH